MQTRGVGGKSRISPMPVVGKKPYGKCQVVSLPFAKHLHLAYIISDPSTMVSGKARAFATLAP